MQTKLSALNMAGKQCAPPGAENMIPPPGRGNWAPWEIVFLVPRTWNNFKQFKTPPRKLGKNVNLFYLNKNYFKSKQKKYYAF